MAANAGSMFQYWKRFDLQQLQVSVFSHELLCLFEVSCEVLVTGALYFVFMLLSGGVEDLFWRAVLALIKVAFSLIGN